MSTLNIPLFPLHTVLFPGGVLPLRIFEPRYLDMVSNCMKTEQGFGVCLIREGNEVGEAAVTFNVGTLSEINYFHSHPNGMLGITVIGTQRFQILKSTVQANLLSTAEVELIPNEPAIPLPDNCVRLVELLQKLIQELGYPYAKMEKRYHDATWVGSRLAEFLPIRLEQKQRCLQMDDALKRLDYLKELIQQLSLGKNVNS